jgi:hypothetical protein
MYSWLFYVSLSLLGLTLLVGVATHWENIFGADRRKRMIGFLSLGLLLLTVVMQGTREFLVNSEEFTRTEFLDSLAREVDEASGATSLGERVFVVDDEARGLYEFKYEGGSKRVVHEHTYKLQASKNVSEPGASREHLAKTLRESEADVNLEEDPKKKVIKLIEGVDDLEGAAAYDNKLYLISSHSWNKRNERNESRELFLEIGLPQKKAETACVERAANLTFCIKNALKGYRDARKLTVDEGQPNVEGLAIDTEGKVYIGLRNPMVIEGGQTYAVILEARVESLFSGDPQARAVLLKLDDSGRKYGIVSLEYDKLSDKVVILGNSSQSPNHDTTVPNRDTDGRGKEAFLPSKLWVWDPKKDGAEPVKVKDWSLSLPKEFDAKAEAIALPERIGYGFLFLDAIGYGGKRVVSRKQLGVPSGAK